jgi:predicted DNA-binding transcriptional regulator AlpA
MSETNNSLREVMREDEARKALGGFGSTQFWALINDGKLPQPFKPYPGARINLWFRDEIIAHQQACAMQRNVKGPPIPRPEKPALPSKQVSRQKQQTRV